MAASRKARRLDCARCGRDVTTIVTEDPAEWPHHRCLGGAIGPFTSSTLAQRVRSDDPLRHVLALTPLRSR